MLCTFVCIISQEESVVDDYLTGTKRHSVRKTFLKSIITCICICHISEISSPITSKEKIKIGTKNKMMNKKAERIESVLHTAINKVAKVAVSIAKSVVTLICLGASVSYRVGIKAREIYDAHNTAKPDANSDLSTEQEVNVPVDNEVEQTEELERIESQHDALNDSFSPVIMKPIVQVNSIENFITIGLRDTLTKNYLEMVSYKLPRNRRTKKTHVRYKDLGVMKEHYPILMATGTLS